MRIGSARSGILVAALGVAVSPPATAGPAVGGFDLSVVVDGETAPEYAVGGRLYIEARKGCEFSLRLSNPSAERVAVAVSVDGRNVIDAKRSSASRAAKWILAPGQTVEIPGWQVSGETARRFFFTETSRSYAKWLGDTSNTGVIEAVFFRERRSPAVPIAPSGWQRQGALRDRPWARENRGAESGAEEGTGDGLSNGESAAADLPGDRSGVGRKSAPPAPALRGEDEFAATGIGERTDFHVRSAHFDADPFPAARVRIRYEFHSELVRLGILPRPAAAFWRDRSRGFEPDYAPDPYRNDRREH